jgi:bifunctional oligoribonuclease and PAP phosphatase NrnA
LIPEEDWDKAVEVLRSSKEVAVCCHVAPDGDAFGSMLALSRALEQLNKKVWVSWGSSTLTVPYSYEFLPGVDKLMTYDRIPERVETFVAIDCADKKRLELLTSRFENAGTSLNIDHHLSNSRYADINLVDPERASSCELAHELIKRMGVPIDPEIATCLYTGVVTDTGRFQYSNTVPETFRVAAELRELGADHLTVAERIYESASLEQLRILGLVLGRARLSDGVVYSWLDTKDLGDQGLDAAEDIIDLLRTVREARITMLLKEQPDGGWKGSLRSRGGGDVAEVAKSFGGGGHAAAAGFSVQGKLEEVINLVLERLAALTS